MAGNWKMYKTQQATRSYFGAFLPQVEGVKDRDILICPPVTDLGDALAATQALLDNNKNPSAKTGQLDNRGSQFYLAKYWAQELAAQTGMNENTIKVKLFRARQKLVKAAQRLDRVPGLVAG